MDGCLWYVQLTMVEDVGHDTVRQQDWLFINPVSRGNLVIEHRNGNMFRFLILADVPRPRNLKIGTDHHDVQHWSTKTNEVTLVRSTTSYSLSKADHHIYIYKFYYIIILLEIQLRMHMFQRPVFYNASLALALELI